MNKNKSTTDAEKNERSDASKKKTKASVAARCVFLTVGFLVLSYCANAAIHFSRAIVDYNETTKKSEQTQKEIQRETEETFDVEQFLNDASVANDEHDSNGVPVANGETTSNVSQVPNGERTFDDEILFDE